MSCWPSGWRRRSANSRRTSRACAGRPAQGERSRAATDHAGHARWPGRATGVVAGDGRAGRRQPADIAMLLRESLDEMRLAIDAFGQAETDLNGALAGCATGWSRGCTPPAWRSNGSVDDGFARLAARRAQALQLLAHRPGGLSNAIKHSRATKLAVRFEADRRYFRVIVSDNGEGFGGGSEGRGRGTCRVSASGPRHRRRSRHRDVGARHDGGGELSGAG